MRWRCKICGFIATTRGDLLTHYRLQHRTFEIGNSVPCLVHDCPCSFKTLNALRTHLSRYHPEDETRGPGVIFCFTCLICSTQHPSKKEYFLHVGNHLRSYETVECVFVGCTFTTNIYGTFFSHKSRKHRCHSLEDFKPDVIGEHQTLSHQTDHLGDSDDEDTSRNHPVDISNEIHQRIGSLLLKLESVHNVSGKCIDDLVEELHFVYTASAPVIRQLVDTSLKKNNCILEEDIVNKLVEELCKSHPISKALGLDGPFGSLYKRRKYFKEQFEFIEPVEYVLDSQENLSFQYVQAHPCLKDPGSSLGLSGWQTSIKYKISNYRTKLRGFGIPDVTCNALKHKCPDDRKSAKNVKKARTAEFNYLPPYPAGEDEHSLEKTREELITELKKKKNNEKMVNDKMSKTFALRRHEVINQCPSVGAMKDRWPALFSCSQISAEFQRITTVPLEPRFMAALDLHTPKLLKLFRAKGGALGQRLQIIMELMEDSSHSSVERTREVVLRCLIEYLGENGEHLITDFNDTEDLEELGQLVVAITVITKTGHSTSDNLKEIGVVIEGMEVITGLGDIARACCLLFGLTYTLNLDYPRQLKYTFEVFQKLFMELDASKLSMKVQSLKSKLLA